MPLRFLQRLTSGRIASAVAWSALALGAGQALSVVTSIVAARVLGRDAFGEFGLVTGALFALAGIAGTGFATTATRELATHRRSEPARAGAVATLSLRVAWIAGLAVSVLVAVFADGVATSWFSRPSLGDAFRAGALVVLGSTVALVQVGVLQGVERFGVVSGIQFGRGLAALAGAVGGAVVGGVAGGAAGLAAAHVLSSVGSVPVVRRSVASAGVALRGGPVPAGLVWSTAVPAVLSNLMVGPVLWAGNAMLASDGGGFGEVALVNATQQWRTALLFVPNVVAQVGLTLLSSAGAGSSDERAAWSRTLWLTHGLGLLAVFPLGTFLVCAGDGLLLLYGRSFASGHAVLAAMLAAVFVQGVPGALGPAIHSRGRFWLGFALNAGWAAVFLAANAVLAPRFGALGYGLALVGAYVLQVLASLALFRSEVPPGFVGRAAAALVVAVVLPGLLAVLPPVVRWVAAVPASLAAAWLVVRVLTPPLFREAIARRWSKLRAGPAATE